MKNYSLKFRTSCSELHYRDVPDIHNTHTHIESNFIFRLWANFCQLRILLQSKEVCDTW